MHLTRQTTLSVFFRKTQLFAAICCLLIICGCKPRIYQFYADTQAVSAEDSIRLHWKVRGTPTLLVHEKHIATTAGDSVRALEFTLVVERAGIDSLRRVQVEIRSGQSTDILSFSAALEGDSVLVAKDVKSTARWSGFTVVKLASASARELRVMHESRTAVLDAAGNFSSALAGTTYAGTWEIRSPLTNEERSDHSKLPNFLRVNAIIQPKK